MCNIKPTFFTLEQFEQFVKNLCDWSDEKVYIGEKERIDNLGIMTARFNGDEIIEVAVYGDNFFRVEEGSTDGDAEVCDERDT